MEYKKLIRMLIPNRIIEGFDHENSEVVIINSLIRLIVGRRARFARLAIIHQAAIMGNTICSPQAIIIVRL